MAVQQDLIDLREPAGHSRTGGDVAPDAIRVLAEALVSDRAAPRMPEPDPHSDADTAIEPRPDRGSDTGQPDAAQPDLQDVGSLPRSIRRRIEVPLAEGESVECAIRAAGDGGAQWVLATSHRILVDQPWNRAERGAMSLPYHRTTVAVTDDGRLHLQCEEFGRSRSTSFEPAAGYELEADHLVERLTES